MSYKLSELMQVLKLNEPATRKMLIDAGADLNELASDPGETVSCEDVIALWHDRANTREGRLLAELLKEKRELEARQAVVDGVKELKKRINNYGSEMGDFDNVWDELTEIHELTGCIFEGLYFDPEPWEVIGG